MILIRVSILLVSLVLPRLLIAQLIEDKTKGGHPVQLLDAAPNNAPFNVLHYELNLRINPTNEYLVGVLIASLEFTSPTQSFHFDLDNQLQVEDVDISEITGEQYIHESDSIKIQLPNQVSVGSIYHVVISYAGNPNRGGDRSITFTNRSGQPHIWTLSQPYGARQWWPCYDHPSQKADSIDLFITVPKPLKVASNGIRVALEDLGNDTRTHWKHRYPVSPYLVSLAIAHYQEFEMDYTDENGDQFPIQDFIFNDFNPSNLNEQLSYTKNCFDVFTHHFGSYPFKNEKYGHAMFNWGGGMEHQTMSSMIGFSKGLVAHELAHQWFGDAITCASWKDIWFNEGFATYSQALMIEAESGEEGLKSWRENTISDITRQADGSVYVADSFFNDISGQVSISRMFDYRLTYQKAAFVIHQIRRKLGDEQFFDALKTLMQSSYLYKSISTEEFRDFLTNFSGTDFTTFFESWVFAEGHPIYTIGIEDLNAVGNSQIQVSLDQQNSAGENVFYDQAINLSIYGFNQDTVIALQPLSINHTEIINLNFRANYARLNEDLQVLADVRTSTALINRLANDEFMNVSNLKPNPFQEVFSFTIELRQAANTSIEIFDSIGRKVFRKEVILLSGANEQSLNLSNVSSGQYFLVIKADNGSEIVQLSRQITKF